MFHLSWLTRALPCVRTQRVAKQRVCPIGQQQYTMTIGHYKVGTSNEKSQPCCCRMQISTMFAELHALRYRENVSHNSAYTCNCTLLRNDGAAHLSLASTWSAFRTHHTWTMQRMSSLSICQAASRCAAVWMHQQISRVRNSAAKPEKATWYDQQNWAQLHANHSNCNHQSDVWWQRDSMTAINVCNCLFSSGYFIWWDWDVL
jgi:hypothetical protein